MTPHMPPRRRAPLARALKADGIDALLVSSIVHVTYLTGFTGSSALLLLPARGRPILISDGRYEQQIAAECDDGLDVYIRPHDQTIQQAAAAAIETANFRTLGFESQHLTVADLETLSTGLPGVAWAPLQGRVEALRTVKDATEVEAIRVAIRAAERAYEMVRATLRPGDTELELADALEGYLRRAGARSAAFPTIVAVGERAALPHAQPGGAAVAEAGWLLLDWGASAPLYKSDLTRVLRLPGAALPRKVESKLEKLYTVVLTAQARAIAAVRPGAHARDVDAAARSYLTEAGYGEQFNHGLGHGIGLQIHEGPAVRANSDDVLQAGMVFTIEPGVYLPGFGGVRIEDDVLVTPGGCEVLTHAAKDWPATVLPG